MRRAKKKSIATFAVRFNREDIVELRHAFSNRGSSHAKTVVFKAIERELRKGPIFGD